MYKKIFFLALILISSVQLIQAQFRPYSNEFMALGVGARGLAMGNAQSAIVNDVSSAYWNPAGLNDVENLQVSAMHAEWFAGVGKYDYIGFAKNIRNDRAVGVSLIRFGVDNIPNTLSLVDGSGNVNYENITTFSSADYGVLLSYAQKLDVLGGIKVGGNVKIIHRKVGSFAKSWGFGIDLGAQYVYKNKLRLGATLRDATSTYNTWAFSFTEEEKEALKLANNEIPVNSVELTSQQLIVGGAYKFFDSDKIDVQSALDLVATFGERNNLIKGPISIDPRIGLEATYNEKIALRLGLNNFQRFSKDGDVENKSLSFQPNVGLGLNLNFLTVDYALTGFGTVASGVYSHIFSVKLDFNASDRFN